MLKINISLTNWVSISYEHLEYPHDVHVKHPSCSLKVPLPSHSGQSISTFGASIYFFKVLEIALEKLTTVPSDFSIWS